MAALLYTINVTLSCGYKERSIFIKGSAKAFAISNLIYVKLLFTALERELL